jgi:hypothetical protein
MSPNPTTQTFPMAVGVQVETEMILFLSGQVQEIH